MKIFEQFQQLMQAKRFANALPLIQDILACDEFNETSWFNYAACLELLGRYDDAIAAFRKGYELDSYDKGFQYRIFRAMSLKGDVKEFTRFAEIEIKDTPEVLVLLEKGPEFADMVAHKWFQFRMRQFRDKPLSGP